MRRWQPDDNDPTVVKRLSPRARTAFAVQESDEDPTVVVQRNVDSRTRTGGWRAFHPASTAAAAQQLGPTGQAAPQAAASLLLIVAQRDSVERADVPALRRQVIEETDRFQQVTQKDGIEAGDIIAARYVLCSASTKRC